LRAEQVKGKEGYADRCREGGDGASGAKMKLVVVNKVHGRGGGGSLRRRRYKKEAQR